MKKQYIETGEIVGTHGINGEMRVQPWSDSPQSLIKLKTFFLDEHGTELKIASSRVHGNILLIKADGVTTIEKAEKLRGKIIFVRREDVLPDENSVLIADLIGCSVLDFETDEKYGEISDVSKTGANDVWHISRNGREYLMPAIKDIVKQIDVDAGLVKISVIPGLFDDEN